MVWLRHLAAVALWVLMHINEIVVWGYPDKRHVPRGPNTFIFMQFLADKIGKHTHFGSWRHPLGKILDPPLSRYNVRQRALLEFS